MLTYLNKAEEAFNNRIPWLFLLGTGVVLVSVLLGIITRLNRKAKIFFVLGLLGFALICLSLTGNHNGFGLGKDSDAPFTHNNTENILTTFSISKPAETTIADAEFFTATENLLYIRVFGAQVFFNDHLCNDEMELSQIITRLYADDLAICIIDDYAQDSVFDRVTSILNQNGILDYEIRESEKD